MNIMMAPSKKLVYSDIKCKLSNGRNVVFFGFVKSTTSMTVLMQTVAKKLLSELYKTWTENYDYIQRYQGEYAYYSLRDTKLVANKFVNENWIDPEKIKMTITAVCLFPDENKAFWINTGDDMIYLYEGFDKMYRCTASKKVIKTARERSIFYNGLNWDLIEGWVQKTPGMFIVVTAECREYFEKCGSEGEKITTEKLKEFAKGKRGPALIAEISAYN